MYEMGEDSRYVRKNQHHNMDAVKVVSDDPLVCAHTAHVIS
jgi:hypothetical protein